MKLPAGYTLVRAGSVRAAIRDDLVATLGGWLLAPRFELPRDAERLAAGRGAAYRVVLAGSPPVVVRLYRRGGVFGGVLHDRYLGLRPRPLRELIATLEARHRGVATPDVLAARVEGWLVYRGVLVTAEVRGGATLLEALRHAPDAGTRRLLATRAGEAVARLHAAGVFHADLNMTNILVHAGRDGSEITLLDFDRARVGSAPLARPARRRNLARLARSLAKLDATETLAGPQERHAFCAAYAGGAPAEAACAS